MEETQKFYSLRNDYAFKRTLIENEAALTKLLSDVLGNSEEEAKNRRLQIPAQFGKIISDKNVELDVKIVIDESKVIDLEMQNYLDHHWSARSLLYNVRCLDTLKAGQRYDQLKPVTMIAFMNYTPISNNPKFYAEYELIDKTSKGVYNEDTNSWISFYIIDLTKRALAQDNEHEQKILQWANLYAAQTMEELHAAAKGNEVFEQMVIQYMEFTADEEAKRCMLAQEDYERRLQEENYWGRQEGLREGQQKGRQENKLETALKMIKRGFSISDIIGITDLPESEVLALSIK